MQSKVKGIEREGEMKDSEWKELENGPIDTKREGDLLRKTRYVEEHPDDYNGPCECQLCCSYGD